MHQPVAEQLRQTLTGKTIQRSLDLTRQTINQDDRTVDIAFSSEDPVEDFPGVFEVLDHSPGSIRTGRLENGLAVLVGHDRDDHVGVVDSFEIGDDKRGRAKVRFGRSERASEIFNDVIDGIRRHISVGFRIHDLVREPTSDDREIFRITDWEALEVSFVSVPADPSVGVGRSLNDDSEISDILNRRHIVSEVQTPTPKVDVDAVRTEGERAGVEKGIAQGREAAQKTIGRILDMGEKLDVMDLARESVTVGRSFEDFAEKAAEAHHERAQKQLDDLERGEQKPVTAIGLTSKEVEQFSLMRALNAVWEGKPELAPFEMEASRAIAQALGKDARGVFVPYEIQKRDMTTGGAGTGAELVGTEHRPQDFIEQLRVNVQAIAAGARLLPGLRENLSMPRKTSGATFAWLPEGGSVTLTDLGTGNLVLSPKTVGGGVKASRRMLKQSSPAIDGLMMSDLAEGAAEIIDLGAFSGSGASNQPTGIENTSGVNTQALVAAGNPTFAEAVGFETELGTDNALRGNLSFVTTSAVVGNMKVRTKDAGSGRFLMEDGMVNGYPVRIANGLAANTVMFGNFNDLVIGMWGVLDLRPDPYTAAGEDALIIRAFQDIDIGVRHAESFCINA